jgi:hypothetical protein
VGKQPPALGSVMRMPSRSKNASDKQTANTNHVRYQQATVGRQGAGMSLTAHLNPQTASLH